MPYLVVAGIGAGVLVAKAALAEDAPPAAALDLSNPGQVLGFGIAMAAGVAFAAMYGWPKLALLVGGAAKQEDPPRATIHPMRRQEDTEIAAVARASVSDDLARVTAHVDGQHARIRESLEKAERDRIALRVLLDGLGSRVAIIERDLAVLTGKADRSTEDIAALRAELRELAKAVDTVQERLAQVRVDIAAALGRLS